MCVCVCVCVLVRSDGINIRPRFALAVADSSPSPSSPSAAVIHSAADHEAIEPAKGQEEIHGNPSLTAIQRER